MGKGVIFISTKELEKEAQIMPPKVTNVDIVKRVQENEDQNR